MAKQTFTTGQVLTAAQMTSLQQTAMLGGAASAKTASYTLVAADAGTAISMSNASATTITVNTALFAAGDTVQITNLGVGVCTITAGTATVNTSASLALAQYESGTLNFTSTSAAIFIKGAGASAGPSVQTYTPTLANLTTGNGTVIAKYAQTGKIVTVYFNFTLGSTSSVGSNPSMTLPVSAADIYNTAKVFLADYGTATFWGNAWNGDATTVYLEVDRADATYLKTAAITSTVPHTWAVNDVIAFTLTYLAA